MLSSASDDQTASAERLDERTSATDMTDNEALEPYDPYALPVPADVPVLPVTFRPTKTRVVVFVVSSCLIVALATVAAILPSGGANPWPVPDRIAFALLGPLISAGLYLLARPRILVTEAGVTVVNTMKTEHLEWAQIVRVNLRPGDPWVLLDLDSGEVLPAMGIQASGGKTARRAAGELRALVDEHTRTERDD